MAKAVRKQYIVKKELQLKLFFELVIFMFFVATLVGVTIYLCILRTLILGLDIGEKVLLSGDKVTLLGIAISWKLLIWFLPTIFAIVIISILLTHKIAGPIFVFQRAINQMYEGQVVRTIHLRKYDKLNDFAEDLNRLIDRFNSEKSLES